jgi:DNA-binding transcriptional MerR regulator
MRSRVNT